MTCPNFGLGIFCDCEECARAQDGLEKEIEGRFEREDMTIKQEFADLADRMRRLVEDLKQQISSLPDNPRIARLGDKCFTMKFSDLGDNWSAGYHDFRLQYRKIVERIENVEPSAALRVVERVIAEGRIDDVRLHPDVLAHLRPLIE